MVGRRRRSSSIDNWRCQEDPIVNRNSTQKLAAQEYVRRKNSIHRVPNKSHVERLVHNRRRKVSIAHPTCSDIKKDIKDEDISSECVKQNECESSPKNVAYVDLPDIDLVIVSLGHFDIGSCDIFKPLVEEEKDELCRYMISILFPDNTFYNYFDQTKSIRLNQNQILDIYTVLLETVFSDEDLCYEIKDLCIEDFLECCFTTRTLSKLLTQLRFEKQYHLSSRALILKSVCNIIPCIYKEVYDQLLCSITDFEISERSLPREDGQETSREFSSIKWNQCGHIHRLVELWEYFVENLKDKKEVMDRYEQPKSICLSLLPSYKKETYKLLLCLLAFLKTRFTISKYSDTCINGTNILLSLYPEYSLQIIKEMCKKWPIGNTDKEISYIHFVENILCVVHPNVCTSSPFPLHPLFTKIFRALQSNHNMLCRRTLLMMQNKDILFNYIFKDEELLNQYKTSLFNLAQSWDPMIKQISEEQFDNLLDYI
ncbi:hypothetical protein WA158_000769 [Blastocystis sp. Blastoise]